MEIVAGFLHCLSQVQELHKKMTEETRRADNLAFEMKKLEEKHEAVMKEKEVRQPLQALKAGTLFFTGLQMSPPLFQRIIMERESLKEMNEELRCSQVQQHQLSQAGTSEFSILVFVRNIKAQNMIQPNSKSMMPTEALTSET